MRKLFVALGLLLTSVSVRADQLFPTAAGTTWEYDSTETLTGTAPVRSVIKVRAGKQLLYGIEVIKLETLSGNPRNKLYSFSERKGDPFYENCGCSCSFSQVSGESRAWR